MFVCSSKFLVQGALASAIPMRPLTAQLRVAGRTQCPRGPFKTVKKQTTIITKSTKKIKGMATQASKCNHIQKDNTKNVISYSHANDRVGVTERNPNSEIHMQTPAYFRFNFI